MSEHTSGPWQWFQSDTGFCHVVGGPQQTVLADLVPRGIGAAANARLMAAAPTLLDACEAAAAYIEAEDCGGITAEVRRRVLGQLNEAIAAARGEGE